MQWGAGLAVPLITEQGVGSTVLARLGFGTLLLVATVRPTMQGHSRRAWVTVVAFGVALGLMNWSFYGALGRLPLGVAVTVEFLGPLALAAALSRRVRDLGAVLAAGVGVALIAQIGQVSLDEVDLLGIALALAAGGCWAAYIVLSARTGAEFPGVQGLALAMVVATVVVLPAGAAEMANWGAREFGIGVGVAVLSSVLPYSFELVALRTLRPEAFGVLMSLEPAVAAGAGWLLLHQILTGWQLAGMVLVVIASAAVQIGRSDDPVAGPPVLG